MCKNYKGKHLCILYLNTFVNKHILLNNILTTYVQFAGASFGESKMSTHTPLKIYWLRN